MFRRSLGIVAVSMAVTFVAAAAPAVAVTKVVQDDQGDAVPRFDITSATFDNGDMRLSGRAHVANLRYGGEQYFSFTFSPRNSPDIFFTAFSRLHADDTITERLTVFNDVGEVSRIACDVRSAWQPEANTVRVSIPRSCVKGLSGRQYMTANLGPSARYGTQDHVRAGYVRQG